MAAPLMTLQLNASLPAAAPSTSAGSSQRGPDAAGYPADRNIRMGTVLRPTTYIRGRHPIIQPLGMPRDWKAFGVIDERSPDLARDDTVASEFVPEKDICGRHFLFDKKCMRLERHPTVIPPLPRDYHVLRRGALHPFSKDLSLRPMRHPPILGGGFAHFGTCSSSVTAHETDVLLCFNGDCMTLTTVGFVTNNDLIELLCCSDRCDLNTSPALFYPSSLVLNGRNTILVENCKLNRPKVNYPTYNLLTVKDNNNVQSYPDPVAGASRSFIHRISELSSLEGYTVRQEKLKKMRKSRKPPS